MMLTHKFYRFTNFYVSGDKMYQASMLGASFKKVVPLLEIRIIFCIVISIEHAWIYLDLFFFIFEICDVLVLQFISTS